ncbi:MAG TPA: hypothetical protein PKH07_18025, partial [bacterium]|nr:hypothetical protein [bacterium]
MSRRKAMQGSGRVILAEGGACSELRSEAFGLIIFGASGDLTHRKLIPALFSLYRRRLLHDSFFVLGCARSLMSDEVFRTKVRESLTSLPDGDFSCLDGFLARLHYVAGDYTVADLYPRLRVAVEGLEQRYGTE